MVGQIFLKINYFFQHFNAILSNSLSREKFSLEPVAGGISEGTFIYSDKKISYKCGRILNIRQSIRHKKNINMKYIMQCLNRSV